MQKFNSRVLVLPVIALLLTSASLSGCSKKSESPKSAAPQAKALSNQDMVRFDNTARAVSRSVGWKKEPSPNTSASNTPANEAPRASTEATQETPSENEVKLGRLVDEKCGFRDLTNIPPIEPQMDITNNKPQTTVMGLEVSGDSCPIFFKFNVEETQQFDFDAKKSSSKQAVRISFQAKSDEAKRLSDVSLYELDVNVEGTTTEKSGTSTAHGKGVIELRSEGKVEVLITGSGMETAVGNTSHGSGQVSVQFRYADGLLVEFKIAHSQKGNEPNTKFYLNNKEIEEKVFNEYMKKFKLDLFSEERTTITVTESAPGADEIVPVAPPAAQ